MLLVPAEEVTEISWDLQTTLQAIVSGGITVPDRVEYTIGVVNPEMPVNAEMITMPNGNNLGVMCRFNNYGSCSSWGN